MAGFSLLGKVKMDASAFYQTMSRMKAAAAPAAKGIGSQLKTSILGGLSVAAAVATVKKSLQDAFNRRKEAGMLGVDTETLQTLQTLSDQTGTSVEDLAKKMEDGSEQGNAFAEAVKQTNQELLDQQRIVDAGTTEKLANVYQRLSEIMGKLAPRIAQVVDGMVTVFGYAQRGMDAAVAGGMNLYGRMTGDASLIQGGQQMGADAFNGVQADATPTSEGTAKQLAAEIGKAIREDKWKEKLPEGKKNSINSSFSSDAAGRIFGVRGSTKSPTDIQLELLNRNVSDIRNAIGLFR